jgi:transposase
MNQIKSKLCIGIDVSKDTLDIYWQSKFYKISNDTPSISAFIKAEIEADKRGHCLCVMESTGGYERGAMNAFHDAKIAVHVAHPSRVHAFAKACGHFAKTDKLDAILLYKYATFISSEVNGDIIHDEEHQEILALRRLSVSLEENLHAAQCRIKQAPSICHPFLQDEIDFYEKKIEQIQNEIETKIKNHPTLRTKRDLMVTMKGVGNKIASVLLAEIPELGTLSRTQIASLVGVAPKTHESGKKIQKARISGGRFYARKMLYMAALVAVRYDSHLKAKYEGLLKRDKPKKAALVAIMRHIIKVLNSMIKYRREYQLST